MAFVKNKKIIPPANRERLIAWLLPALIVALSVFLRFWNLDTTPLWYSDEGVNLNLAWNLANGNMQTFACTYSFVSHPPFFYLISGSFLKLFGYSILSARMLTALCGVITTLLLYFIGKELANRYVGLMASFLFAIFPMALLYNRWDFDYNLLQTLTAFTLFAAIKYIKTKNLKWFFGTSLAAGLASVTSLIGIGLVCGLAVFFFIEKNFKKTLAGILLAASVFVVYMLSMLALQMDAFVFSLTYAFSKHSPGLQLFLYDRLKNLIIFSPWFTIGVLGLVAYPLFFRKKKESLAVLGFFCLLLLFTLMLFKSQLIQVRGITQLFPFLTLGVAIAVTAILQTLNPTQPQLFKILKKAKASRKVVISFWLCATCLLAAPLGIILYEDVHNVTVGFQSGLDHYCVQSPDDAYAVADYLNRHTTSSDFVLVSPQIAWLINCNSTTLTQAMAFNHLATKFYPDDMDENRFLYNCSYTNAKFLVSDYFSEVSTFKQENVEIIALNITSSWKLTYEIGEYQVYLNPTYEK